jgi:hypothetical protein
VKHQQQFGPSSARTVCDNLPLDMRTLHDMQAERMHPDMIKSGFSLRDVDQLSLYYCRRIFQMVASMRHVRLRIATTACTYFHRFYHTQSMMERDPRVVSIACVYLAGAPSRSCVCQRPLGWHMLLASVKVRL